VRIRVIDMVADENDSNANAFRAAATMATMHALEHAKPCLLEPIMSVEVVAPADYVGNVHSDLGTRRGRVQGMEPRGNMQAIAADVPLAAMVGYATELRSVTQGHASYSMHFSRYGEVPGDLQEEIVRKIRGY
jgi:elongation factor G